MYMYESSDCYQMCIQKPPNCFTPQLYDRYEETFANYLTTRTFPALLEKSGIYVYIYM